MHYWYSSKGASWSYSLNHINFNSLPWRMFSSVNKVLVQNTSRSFEFHNSSGGVGGISSHRRQDYRGVCAGLASGIVIDWRQYSNGAEAFCAICHGQRRMGLVFSQTLRPFPFPPPPWGLLCLNCCVHAQIIAPAFIEPLMTAAHKFFTPVFFLFGWNHDNRLSPDILYYVLFHPNLYASRRCNADGVNVYATTLHFLPSESLIHDRDHTSEPCPELWARSISSSPRYAASLPPTLQICTF